jgi:hypothetical protein
MSLSPNTAAIVKAIYLLSKHQGTPIEGLLKLDGPVGDMARRASQVRDAKGYDYKEAFEQAAEETGDPYMEMFASIFADYNMDPKAFNDELLRLMRLANSDAARVA